jgi:hypothetical protein
MFLWFLLYGIAGKKEFIVAKHVTFYIIELSVNSVFCSLQINEAYSDIMFTFWIVCPSAYRFKGKFWDLREGEYCS